MRKAGAVKTRERKKHRPQMPAVDTPPANQPAKTSAKIFHLLLIHQKSKHQDHQKLIFYYINIKNI